MHIWTSKDEEFADWMINGYKFQVKRVEDLMKVDDQFIKISAYKKHGVQEATESLREQFGDRLKMTISGDMWMDCMAIGVSKGQATRSCRKVWRLSRKKRWYLAIS